MSQLFNNKGELNASTVKEALQSVVKIASLLEEGNSVNTALTGPANVNESRKDELISRALQTQEGKLALAQAMANPIN